MHVRKPLPPSSAPVQPLNRSEWVYLAMEPFLGSMAQAYVIRFEQVVSEADLRQAARRLLSAFPRLRTALEPTPRRFQFRILPEDHHFEQLFDIAFRSEHIDLDDPQAVRRWHEIHVNDPMALQHGLMVRFTHVPHPTRSALMLTVHHVLFDGRSMVHLVESLMKLLNGQPVADVPLESSSMLPAILPNHWWEWPGKVWAAWKHLRAEAREVAQYEIVRLRSDRSERFTSCGVLHHQTGQAGKALSKAGKGLGGSSNSLMIAAMGTALLEMNGNRPGTAALVRVGVDLRKYFPEGRQPLLGNYVFVFDVLLPQQVPEAERVKWIDARVRAGLARYERRELLLPLLPYELMGFMSTQMYSRLMRRAKRMDQFPPLSFHASNIGSVDAFNAADARVRLAELHPSVSSVVPLVVLAQSNGQQRATVAYQRDEFGGEGVATLMSLTNEVLARWVAHGEG